MNQRIRGGAVVPADPGAHGLVQLLMFHNRAQIDLTYYSHPYDVDVDADLRFLIVLSAESFEGVVKFYDAKRRALPLIVHIDTPGALENYDHARLFPGVNVLAFRQAALDGDRDVTLELNLFGKIVGRLRESA